MKRSLLVQLVIDIVIVFFGMGLFLFPKVVTASPNMVFFLTMSIYAGLELCEFVFDRTRIEPLCIFITSGTAAFSSIFLRDFPSNYVLSITVATWIFAISVVKLINIKGFYQNKMRLFLIKLTIMSMFVLPNILVAINLFYELSPITYMLAFTYMNYGILEFISDFLEYLSDDVKFLKE